MKILFIAESRLLKGQTGDATQYRETLSGLRSRGHTVSTIFMAFRPFLLQDEQLNEISVQEFRSRCAAVDVIHLLPARYRVCRFLREQKISTPIVGSTIYWGGRERVILAFKNRTSFWVGLRNAFRYFLQMLKPYMDYRGIKVFLPNTWAEGQTVRKYFRADADALCVPVPNGFNLPDFDVYALPRPDCVPEGDYLVVPGVITARKNQLSLIKALRKTNYPVVFMGGADFDKAYFARCQKYATNNMKFIGYVPSQSEKYWAVLRHARCACLASDCETPGIALLEAAYAGARPVVTQYGGTAEYYGFDAEYLNPTDEKSILNAIERGWKRGRLTAAESRYFAMFTWQRCVDLTEQAYVCCRASDAGAFDIIRA